MISKRTSDEKLKKRLEQTLRENIKKRKLQKQMRDLEVTPDNSKDEDKVLDQELRKSSS
jgi:hypothetical protein